MEVNLALQVHLVEIMTTERFRKKFPMLVPEVKSFLQRMIAIEVSAAKTIYKIMKKGWNLH